MLRHCITAVCALGLILPAVALPALTVTPGKTRTTSASVTLDEARAAFLRGLATKDTAQLRVAFTEDAITLFAQSSGQKPNSGMPQIQQFYADLFSRVAKSVEMKFVPGEVVRGKAVATETGTWNMPAFGTSGIYRMVYLMGANASWRIAYWHASPAAP